MDTTVVDVVGQEVVCGDTVVEVSVANANLGTFFFLPYTIVLVERRGVVLGGRTNLQTVDHANFKKRFIKVPRRDNGTTEDANR